MKKTMILSVVWLFILSACNSSSSKSEEGSKGQAQSSDTKPEISKSDSSAQTFKLDTNTLKKGQTYFQCPMDLEVISNKEGQCPICGMDLELVTKQ